MALFTTADRDAVKSALITAATDGVASVTVAGQTVTSKTVAELRSLLDMILADIGADDMESESVLRPFRMVKTVPPGAG